MPEIEVLRDGDSSSNYFLLKEKQAHEKEPKRDYST
jgi:hypothetical protein